MESTGSDVRPDTDLPAEVDATLTCVLTADGRAGAYDVTVPVASVEGDPANEDVVVGDTPR